MRNSGAIQKDPHAFEVPFDKDNDPSCGFQSETVQEAIEELCEKGGDSASSGFSWGSSGNIPANSWLNNESVPSNKTGRNFSLYNGELVSISVSNENSSTFSIELYEHDGVTFTLLATVSLIAQRSLEALYTGISITKGRELAVKQATGSSKNPIVQVIAKGTRTP
jgi:hypothetical protein